jgi:hypothetical protein
MKTQISNLGVALTKEEQQTIQGSGHTCRTGLCWYSNFQTCFPCAE